MKKTLFFNDLAGGGVHFLGKILLVFVSGLSLVSTANATCNPPIGKCDCSYPIMENGSLKCGPTYCPSDTKCMPNGSCCPSDNSCGTGDNRDCCDASETCVADTICCPLDKPHLIGTICVGCTSDTDCSDGKKCNMNTYTCYNLKDLCENAGLGYLQLKDGREYCYGAHDLFEKAKSSCEDNEMRMATFVELCPGSDCSGIDAEDDSVNTYITMWFWSAEGHAISNGYVTSPEEAAGYYRTAVCIPK